MSELQAAPRLPKWPFILADLIISAIAAYVLMRLGVIQGTTHIVIAIACLLAAAWGAWLSITPWLVEFRTRAAIAENSNLKSTLDQIQNLEKVADLIRQANSQWQGVQDTSSRTVTAAREIADRMKVETEEFMKFIENAHDQERTGLRLEVDKMRKMEGDWIKVAVQMLDHVFALFRAAEKSGQDNLVSQLAQFQNACRDAARRMGLVPFVPLPGDKYDPRAHQLPNPPPVIDESATLSEILATGFTYQGQLLRRSLVLLNDGRRRETALTSLPEPLSQPPQHEVRVFKDEPSLAEQEALGENIPQPPSTPEEPGSSRRSQDPGAQNELPLV